MSIVETEVEKPAAQGAAMEITVSRQELVKELTATQSVVERKTTIPILSNFLIEADGDRLNITATDLDQAIRTSAAVKVKKPGSCTIPARKLYDYIKLLPDGEISIKLLENHWVQIRCGPLKHQDGGHGARELSAGAGVPGGVGDEHFGARVEDADCADDLCDFERRVALHAERRTDGAEGGVDCDGGDRRAPAVVRGEAGREPGGHQRREAGADSAQGAAGAAELLSNTEAEKVEFADDEHTLFFRVGHRTLSSRKLSGQFPNLRSGDAAGQHEVRRSAVERAVVRDPAGGAVCR